MPPIVLLSVPVPFMPMLFAAVISMPKAVLAANCDTEAAAAFLDEAAELTDALALVGSIQGTGISDSHPLKSQIASKNGVEWAMKINSTLVPPGNSYKLRPPCLSAFSPATRRLPEGPDHRSPRRFQSGGYVVPPPEITLCDSIKIIRWPVSLPLCFHPHCAHAHPWHLRSFDLIGVRILCSRPRGCAAALSSGRGRRVDAGGSKSSDCELWQAGPATLQFCLCSGHAEDTRPRAERLTIHG
ncbi:hypothetical protein FB45DRAFT_161841 [Roridomyces roridus]|uniref:Uncharacterized protein n=1 Tax=Roridomyces roridus TaxID=1738132 RepID=A0AAD7BFQ9_9AGAR|nr:hypothetical protein FB45DRAFT_161841 [Roridomyces roridus]